MDINSIYEGFYEPIINDDLVLDPPPYPPQLIRTRANSYNRIYYFDNNNILQIIPNFQVYIEEPPFGIVLVIESINTYPYKKMVWYTSNNFHHIINIGDNKNDCIPGREIFSFNIFHEDNIIL
jgi:hypothetical protein